jgi:hypothetical protein
VERLSWACFSQHSLSIRKASQVYSKHCIFPTFWLPVHTCFSSQSQIPSFKDQKMVTTTEILAFQTIMEVTQYPMTINIKSWTKNHFPEKCPCFSKSTIWIINIWVQKYNHQSDFWLSEYVPREWIWKFMKLCEHTVFNLRNLFYRFWLKHTSGLSC